MIRCKCEDILHGHFFSVVNEEENDEILHLDFPMDLGVLSHLRKDTLVFNLFLNKIHLINLCLVGSLNYEPNCVVPIRIHEDGKKGVLNVELNSKDIETFLGNVKEIKMKI